jgi:ubiquitin-like-conjugating enzyme ATG3
MEDAFRFFKSTREFLTPVLTESQFYEKGMLTPEEFVRAGDHMIRTCPSWSWESGESSKVRSHLPRNKQYLCTRGVPSYSRASSLQSSRLVEEKVEGGMGEAEGDWCAPELLISAEDEFEDEVLVEASDAMEDEDTPMKGSQARPNESTVIGKGVEQTLPSAAAPMDEYEDMEEADMALDDQCTVNNLKDGDASTSAFDNTIRARRYDVTITYDNYYRVPRIWLFGFNENGSGLSTYEIYQDIMQDYAKKTVTIDPHPHLSNQHASIHPCQHATAMLSILSALKECGNLPSVDQYMLIFLKFIQSVVPTIEYDYTTDVQVGKSEH